MALTSIGSIAQTYQVVDLGGVENTRHSFATAINNNGDVVGVSQDHFNYPIDFDNLNYAALEIALLADKGANPGVFDDVNFDNIVAANVNSDELDYIKRFLASAVNSNKYQKLGNQSAFIADASGTTELGLFDQHIAQLNDKSRSTVDLVTAINDEGVSVASATAMYEKTEFTPPATDDNPLPSTVEIWTKDFLDRKGVISKGDQRVVIEAPFTEYGGASFFG